MRARRIALLAAATLAAMSTAPAAQAQKAPAPLARPTKADLDGAAFKLRVVISALQSPNIETPLKNALFACLYENPMGKISAEADRVIAGNKLDKANTSDVLTVVAGVCGYRPAAAGPAKPR